MTLREILHGLGAGDRLEVLLIIYSLGVADRRTILRTMREDETMLSPPWQQVRRCLVWLCASGLVNEQSLGPGKRILYTANKEQWMWLLDQMQNIV
jgi:Fe2+ or Zn2+ uptake regulation protein